MGGEGVEIPGDMLEGGGQIVRVAAGLAAVSGRPVRITNVRAKRSPPGLRPQHVAALGALAKVTQGDAQGLHVGSREVQFTPGEVKGGSYAFDVGTAGSTTLVLQALLPALSCASGPVNVRLVGGTNNPMAPPMEYFREILLPVLALMGVNASVKLRRRGFYPRGGGTVEATVAPSSSLRPVQLVESRKPETVSGLAYSSRLPCHIVERMMKAARVTVGRAGYSLPEGCTRLECLQAEAELCALSPGCGIFLKAEVAPGVWVAGDSLGELGKPAEKVGGEAAEGLLRQLDAARPVDSHLLDQLIPWMALVDGRSTVSATELTLHALTCIEVAGRITGARYHVDGRLGEPVVVKCEGVRSKCSGL